jgi:putative ABC transport system permease protein
MQWWNEARRKLAALRHREKLDRDLAEEMQSHLELQAEENRANGMSAEQARYAALRRFGNATALKETSREVWGWRVLDELVRDLRLAFRTLRRGPGFAAIAVITLALGIGLNMAVFALVFKVVLRPVEYRDANRLMDVHLILTEERRGTIPMSWSYPKFQELLQWNRSFDSIAAEQADTLTLTGVDEPLTAEIVSARYFQMIGVNARLGRVFTEDEDLPAGTHSAMLVSDGFWRSHFAADPGVIGRTQHFSGLSLTIVGVMPPGFKGETGRTDAWAPMAAYLAINPNPSRAAHNLEAIGHLRPGVSPRQADEDVRQLVARMEREHPTVFGGKWSGGARPLLEARVDPQVHKALWILQAATLCVLLIACVNLANLLLGRGAARRRELAIRLALGTSRGALMRQLLVEPVMLALAGGAAGLFLAAAGLRALSLIFPPANGTFYFEYTRFIDPESFRLELPLVVGGFLLALITGIAFGLLPAWQAARADLNQGLRTGLEAAGPRHVRLRNGLVVAQMALALVLLAGANLAIRSFAALLATNFGAETRNIITMQVQPRSHDEAVDRAFYSELQRRAAALPGVQAAAVSSMMPAFDTDQGTQLRIDGQGIGIQTAVNWSSPSYFKLFRIPTLAGRVFDQRDKYGSPLVVVLGESAARRFFPGMNPLGRRIDYPSMSRNRPEALGEVIGVVADVRYGAPGARTGPVVYASTLQTRPGAFLEVRAARDPRTLAPALRQVAHTIDPEVRVYDVRTMDQVIDLATWRARLAATLLGLMAALSLAIAAVGIYGVFSYTVAARSREIGVRLALGAGRERILGMVLREGATLSAAAVAVGLPPAWALTRVLTNQLYRVSPTDPATYVSVSALLFAVALLACYVPARRATRIDPMATLRSE